VPDVSHFWHPFADMAAVASRGPTELVRGEGIWVFDADGNRYLDGTASLWYCNVGWGRDAIAEAAADQLRRLPAYSTFGDLTNGPAEALADRVSALSPVEGSEVFLTSGGSDSIDTATKMARRYWQLKGEPDRTVLFRREKAYHGMHAAGSSLAGIPANAAGHGPLIEDVVEVAWDDADALAGAIAEVGPGRAAAFFCEPVLGAGGVYPPPPGYLEAARAACRETGVLFVADEVITGFGRCGAWFASGRFELEPDLITCAKGITSGYLPMGAVIAAPWVAEPFWAPGAGVWRHGYTYSGHATGAAAALANLDILEGEDLCGRALELEGALVETLRDLEHHELVEEVRGGLGLLAAVNLRRDLVEADAALPGRVGMACREAGLLIRPLVGGALAVSPPLVITRVEIDELASRFRAGLDACA
jgi:adenosylmethionine-8-amino-7-oxononanoate aminotransferase